MIRVFDNILYFLPESGVKHTKYSDVLGDVEFITLNEEKINGVHGKFLLYDIDFNYSVNCGMLYTSNPTDIDNMKRHFDT